jgi:hypothetical protein
MARILRTMEEILTVPETVLLGDAGDPETTYRLRKLPTAEQRAIVARYTTWVVNKQTHQKEERIDQDKVGQDLIDAVIVGWEGVLRAGEPAVCDRDNKLDLDTEILTAIIEWARKNDRAEQRDASFRRPALVPGVVGG